ncbi:hypothetical protein HUK80_17665 [Flavobacterium sp. MAH-1]|uniref:Uncharacterized protein n=1 Tax=Flavobacterium agri TaxID=2743471 RepID=A0A7Y8Y558_9FLAO|nr:hypothetical protein [Flavobacterium agri]NUY82735.1 hypothetical protein [Flavobacterium agri]NYA72758.1 hypothetical protein [Flavobacterium agri]
MNINEPELRFPTQKARIELASELNLEYHDGMQDWEWEVAKSDEVERYISHYRTLNDEDKKFALMEIIIQAVTDQKSKLEFEKYWNVVKDYLIKGFKIHAYSVYYWSCFDYENIDDCWEVTPYMRNLWNNCNVG